MNINVYLASPFFTPEQSDREVRVANKLKELGFNVIRPREFGVLAPDASEEERQYIVNKDLMAITSSDFLFCVTNDKDMGSMIEYGYSIAKSIPRAILAEGFTGKVNVMLASTAHAVFTSIDEITKEALLYVVNKKKYNVYSGPTE